MFCLPFLFPPMLPSQLGLLTFSSNSAPQLCPLWLRFSKIVPSPTLSTSFVPNFELNFFPVLSTD